MKIQDFVVLDLETTGLSVKEDQILEIGAVKVQGGEVTASYETFVNPGRKVPERITELTGTSCKMISATRNWTITVRAAFIGQSAVPPSMRAFTPTLPPPMPIGRAQPMPSMLPVITAPCPPAAAGAAPPASPSVRSMYCPQSGKLPRAPSGL